MTFEPGQQLDPQSYAVTRGDLVRYAGASGDFNPIHWSDRVAAAVGLPGVIAHGMYTLALAGRALTTWVDDPARVISFGARFTKPVVVPDDDTGADVEVAGVVTSVEDGVATIDLTVTSAGQKVLGMSKATVRC
ncbi:MAG: MaoC family dehydratase [Nocardioidaceae bacterium]|nr:MaoC family dehydratase [Nocardioidaceae bacterium]